ncbi:hydrolase [Thioalkalivibrio sulfidiphilus HL-EbGr7]|uniref:Hydrolase n=1 Tax=Thioalkalivibrio sulfidiphilus (strain HL-EbGR7) TaxID=396588 RepID=B8GP41_THISH|nr:CPCC family cysteine-rich protein [Thioalkalivibrio sulfidiphilus]ACL73961.1 hydrolase [Thioalkalivibrio sulfidiphilus HL-EbGr7]
MMISFGEAKFPCPVCGYQVFDMQPGSHHRCPICCWEDNLVQLRFPLMPGGSNTVSLERAQQNYREFGAAERRHEGMGRKPVGETRDTQWRPLDPARDNIEQPARGIDYADSYPVLDTTVLYYWSERYWRRVAG